MESGEAIVGRRKRIWKRLRFWSGVLLVVVVGIGILAWVTYRKAMGPPPTPPGKSPEFDQHLADIDKDWLFLFEHDRRLVLIDIYGRDICTLRNLDEIKNVLDCPDSFHEVCWHVSPNGRRVVLGYDTAERLFAISPAPELLFLDLLDNSTELVIPEAQDRLERRLHLVGGDYSWDPENIYWLDESTVIVALDSSFRDDITPESEEGFSSLLICHIDKPVRYHEARLPVAHGPDPFGKSSVFDKHSRTLLYVAKVDEKNSGRLMAYDKDGLREANDRDKKRFKELTLPKAHINSSASEEPPRVVVKHVKHSFFGTMVMRCLSVEENAKCEIRLDGKRVRLFEWKPPSNLPPEVFCLPEYSGEWHDDLELFIWREHDGNNPLLIYYVDRKGHYRFWHKGGYWGKIPRWKGESKEAE